MMCRCVDVSTGMADLSRRTLLHVTVHRDRFLFHNQPDALLLFLQSALQPLWVLACSTIVEYSQQEGFYRVLLPAVRQTPNLEDQ